jgi:cysteinyl-tRNA synthetase
MIVFEAAMDDDFNTAGALAVVFDLVSEVNKHLASKARDWTHWSLRGSTW